MSEQSTSLPPLNALRVFEVAARQLNFRRAADELGVTQGAVAQQVRSLEAHLGIRLFERLPRGLGLTEAGRSYQASIRRAFELMIEATQMLRPEPLHLTLSVTPTFASRWLIPRLPDFTDRYPHIDLRVLATDRLSSFQHDAVDLAVRYGRAPFGPGLDAQWLMPQRLVAVASPLRVEALGDPGVADNLSRYTLLHDAHNLWPAFLSQVCDQPLLAATRNLRFNQTSLAIEAAIAGQGLALANEAFVRADLEAGRLVCVFGQALQVDTGFYLIAPRKARRPAPLTEVRHWLLAQAQPPDQA
ncbi:LysR family transcriptional regulator [Pseudomonas syringae]|nr:LysR family transcriptional regulator [Pseudomonas syringae]MBD8577825.1 LysR family transcriptional regulator [Pseudomonas syringae]MBD8793325.1 LysR family transcriptional regulator [Pseudomonas syringae]MBD8804087.1 LysR family transcriptional regulator [Pseudomonas syringae]MBD8814859.1 LysR family transcriptional regulator [Pseudomonas syringae]